MTTYTFDDFVGTYQMGGIADPALAGTLERMTVQADGGIILQGGTEDATVNPIPPGDISWDLTIPNFNLKAPINLVQGGTFDLDAYLGFSDYNGVWSASGGVRTPSVTYGWVGSNTFADLTQANLDQFKALFPDNHQVQAVTLSQLVQFAAGKPVDGQGATPDPSLASRQSKKSLVPPCEWACGMVLLDAAFVVSGMAAIRTALSESLDVIFEAAFHGQPLAEMVPHIEQYAATIANPNSSATDIAWAVFYVAKTAYTGGMLEAIYRAIVQSLTWWDMILYGVLGIAEIAATFLTDGAAFVALVAAELALVGFLISDALKVPDACKASTTEFLS